MNPALDAASLPKEINLISGGDLSGEAIAKPEALGVA
jgi:hypothetical protein